MVDIGEKKVTRRVAKAQSIVQLPENVAKLFSNSGYEIQSPKGPVLATAVIAGVMAAKQTSQLLPFCHPLPIEKCDIKAEFLPQTRKLVLTCTVATSHKTGVEMEALTGSSVAALCVYDMCKALSHEIVIQETKLLSKTGGKQDYQGPEQ